MPHFSGEIIMKSRHWVPWVFVGIVCFLLRSWAALDSVARTAGLSGTDKRPQRFYGGRVPIGEGLNGRRRG
ncbi:MAG: hypothetical protein B5M55_01695 [Desulfococcus sp. 4484_242]|nr:MAG: hypothetical protein B5M55_01695 [Desulfococcus sp. 4484_242]